MKLDTIETADAVPAEAAAVVGFWLGAGPDRWFAKDPAFDARFRDRFLAAHEAAVRGELAGWAGVADAALARVILLDQFPRNAFRGTPRMYASDAQARDAADAAIAAGHDRRVPEALRLFFYLPFGHSEASADQARSVALAEALGEPTADHARHHRDLVARFGRFPHRNAILGRPETPEERAFLDAGGYAG